MQKIIGFDIDGVLTTPDSRAWESELVRYFQFSLLEDPEKRDLQTRYSLTREQMLDFYHQCSHYVFPKLVMREGANTVLAKLRDLGFTIILITARTNRPETPLWLEKHHIPYDLLVHQHDKLPACLEHRLELFVEDNVENALSVSTALPVLLMDTEYNRIPDLPKNIHRVHNFSEVSKFILDFFQKQIA